MSGGGGSGLCSHFRGICTEGPNYPDDRGSVFHAVEFTVSQSGEISLRIIQAFAGGATERGAKPVVAPSSD